MAENKTIYEKCLINETIDDKLIFFESFRGQSYSHNPKYIYEKMLEMGYDKNYEFVWSYQGKLEIPGNPVIVNRIRRIILQVFSRLKILDKQHKFSNKGKETKHHILTNNPWYSV